MSNSSAKEADRPPDFDLILSSARSLNSKTFMFKRAANNDEKENS